MRPQQQRCFYCDSPATLLCDFHLGFPFGGYVIGPKGKYAVTTIEKPIYTCDIPLCREHAEYRGWLHINAGRNSRFDSYDYCPEHRGMTDTDAPVMEESEAERLRRVVQAHAQRRIMRERGALKAPPRAPEQATLF
jgi:hypothetical protein